MSPAAVAKLCGIQGETPQNFHNITSANNLRTKLKPKKQYEIDRIVTTVELLRRRDPGTSAFDTIIDIGAGMGHLARILSASIPECNVIAVEQNEELIERSILLNDRLQQIKNGFRLPEHYCESVQSGFSGSVLRSLNEDDMRLIANCRSFWNIIQPIYSGQKALLIGLHPCGDLSASILRIFTRSPKVTTMILFGCCYHKLSTAEEEANCSQADSGELGFPLSAKYRWKSLSYAARDLACHGIETFAEQLLTKPHSAYRMQCYRAVLESLITKSHDEKVCKERSSIVVHSVAGKDGMTFEEYMRSALVKYPEIEEALEKQIIHDEESRCIIKSVDIEWRRFLVVHCLRLLFAPIVEQIIIKDRVQYLEECGHSVVVVPLFDPRISPRNFAIIAMKDR
ncbi:hypothetical protein ANCCAN_23797 [Ancylostoma caninum]|uniref:Methyltransferase domain-containing protein n=1 Tax=Ancylostoma caninum TaxID=29170 RepID=A0A368FFU1_ANCCA|nr:hypothetical protein ANCCAN_23797 [Ancylostoma caninum]